MRLGYHHRVSRAELCLVAALSAAGCSPPVLVLAPPEGTVSAILVEHRTTTSKLRVIDPAEPEPLELDDAEDLELILLAYDAPLAEVGVIVGADGEVARATNPDAEAWPLPLPTRWRSYRGLGGDVVDHSATEPLDLRTSAINLRRAPCVPVEGYDTTLVPLDPFDLVQISLIERDLALVSVFGALPEGTVTASVTVYLVERTGQLSTSGEIIRTSTTAQIGGVRDRDGLWMVVADEGTTDLYRIDDDATFTLHRTLRPAVDVGSVRVLRDGTWLAVASAPPALLALRPGGTSWQTIVSGEHPEPDLEAKCLLAFAHPQILVDEDAQEALVSVVGMGLFRVRIDRPGTWSQREVLAESGAFCEVQVGQLDGGAEVVFSSKLFAPTEVATTVAWRPARDATWRPLQSYRPLNFHAFGGRTITVSSNRFLYTFDFEPRRPEVEPRRCTHPGTIATRAHGVGGQFAVVGDGDLEDRGIVGVLVQWLDFVRR